ncbi:protein of unknown function [Kyrpidia spormannii]|uniref:Uncharacterized protein n=1 Tax=Kyrpidia spormannii TaxID=2055160 RepID=A0ACA8ZCA5_9BACL|nr:protein of unknown function [Kyrpidia spormannii]
MQDVLEIITVFSARLYGSRSRSIRDIMKQLKEAADAICPENASGGHPQGSTAEQHQRRPLRP